MILGAPLICFVALAITASGACNESLWGSMSSNQDVTIRNCDLGSSSIYISDNSVPLENATLRLINISSFRFALINLTTKNVAIHIESCVAPIDAIGDALGLEGGMHESIRLTVTNSTIYRGIGFTNHSNVSGASVWWQDCVVGSATNRSVLFHSLRGFVLRDSTARNVTIVAQNVTVSATSSTDLGTVYLVKFDNSTAELITLTINGSSRLMSDGSGAAILITTSSIKASSFSVRKTSLSLNATAKTASGRSFITAANATLADVVCSLRCVEGSQISSVFNLQFATFENASLNLDSSNISLRASSATISTGLIVTLSTTLNRTRVSFAGSYVTNYNETNSSYSQAFGVLLTLTTLSYGSSIKFQNISLILLAWNVGIVAVTQSTFLTNASIIVENTNATVLKSPFLVHSQHGVAQPPAWYIIGFRNVSMKATSIVLRDLSLNTINSISGDYNESMASTLMNGLIAIANTTATESNISVQNVSVVENALVSGLLMSSSSLNHSIVELSNVSMVSLSAQLLLQGTVAQATDFIVDKGSVLVTNFRNASLENYPQNIIFYQSSISGSCKVMVRNSQLNVTGFTNILDSQFVSPILVVKSTAIENAMIIIEGSSLHCDGSLTGGTFVSLLLVGQSSWCGSIQIWNSTGYVVNQKSSAVIIISLNNNTDDCSNNLQLAIDTSNLTSIANYTGNDTNQWPLAVAVVFSALSDSSNAIVSEYRNANVTISNSVFSLTSHGPVPEQLASTVFLVNMSHFVDSVIQLIKTETKSQMAFFLTPPTGPGFANLTNTTIRISDGSSVLIAGSPVIMAGFLLMSTLIDTLSVLMICRNSTLRLNATVSASVGTSSGAQIMAVVLVRQNSANGAVSENAFARGVGSVNVAIKSGSHTVLEFYAAAGAAASGVRTGAIIALQSVKVGRVTLDILSSSNVSIRGQLDIASLLLTVTATITSDVLVTAQDGVTIGMTTSGDTMSVVGPVLMNQTSVTGNLSVVLDRNTTVTCSFSVNPNLQLASASAILLMHSTVMSGTTEVIVSMDNSDMQLLEGETSNYTDGTNKLVGLIEMRNSSINSSHVAAMNQSTLVMRCTRACAAAIVVCDLQLPAAVHTVNVFITGHSFMSATVVPGTIKSLDTNVVSTVNASSISSVAAMFLLSGKVNLSSFSLHVINGSTYLQNGSYAMGLFSVGNPQEMSVDILISESRLESYGAIISTLFGISSGSAVSSLAIQFVLRSTALVQTSGPSPSTSSIISASEASIRNVSIVISGGTNVTIYSENITTSNSEHTSSGKPNPAIVSVLNGANMSMESLSLTVMDPHTFLNISAPEALSLIFALQGSLSNLSQISIMTRSHANLSVASTSPDGTISMDMIYGGTSGLAQISGICGLVLLYTTSNSSSAAPAVSVVVCDGAHVVMSGVLVAAVLMLSARLNNLSVEVYTFSSLIVEAERSNHSAMAILCIGYDSNGSTLAVTVTDGSLLMLSTSPASAVAAGPSAPTITNYIAGIAALMKSPWSQFILSVRNGSQTVLRGLVVYALFLLGCSLSNGSMIQIVDNSSVYLRYDPHLSKSAAVLLGFVNNSNISNFLVTLSTHSTLKLESVEDNSVAAAAMNFDTSQLGSVANLTIPLSMVLMVVGGGSDNVSIVASGGSTLSLLGLVALVQLVVDGTSSFLGVEVLHGSNFTARAYAVSAVYVVGSKGRMLHSSLRIGFNSTALLSIPLLGSNASVVALILIAGDSPTSTAIENVTVSVYNQSDVELKCTYCTATVFTGTSATVRDVTISLENASRLTLELSQTSSVNSAQISGIDISSLLKSSKNISVGVVTLLNKVEILGRFSVLVADRSFVKNTASAVLSWLWRTRSSINPRFMWQ